MKSNVTFRRFAAAVTLVLAGSVLSACLVTPGDPGPADVTFAINTTTSANHPISPLIYGSNSDQGLATNRQTNLRLGGNRWTAYNWENNDSNAGSDYCFQNDDFLSSSLTPGAAIKPTVDEATAAGDTAIVTIPIVDYVAADRNGGCDVRNSGANYLQTRFKQNLPTKGAAFTTTPSTSDGYVYQDEFVNWLKTTEPNAHIIFQLDNEPDLWSSTHAEVHPNPVTYAELVQRNIAYAKAIKAVWPTAEVDGPVDYGFYGMERLQGAPDNGGRDWITDLPRPDERPAPRWRASGSSTTSTCTGTPRRPAAASASPTTAPARPRWRPASRRRGRCGTRATSRPAGSPTRPATTTAPST